MSSIDVFYQGEGIREIAHFEADPEQSFAALKLAIIEKHGMNKDTLIYLEDSDEPLDERHFVRDHVGRAGIKAHLHRCRHVAVAVTFLLVAIGLSVEFIAWTTGLGAAIITGLGRWYTVPPPISVPPAQPTANATAF